MRVLTAAFLFIGSLFLFQHTAQAAVGITVDLSSQTMQVTSSTGEHFAWPVSTARGGFATPRGTYRPTSLQRMHYSRKYHMSPMPYSIFFKGGYAIHGTYDTAALGRPASHGCVRLLPANAARLFEMVRAEGAVIKVVGTAPHRSYVASRRTPAGAPMAFAPVRHAPNGPNGIFNRFTSPPNY